MGKNVDALAAYRFEYDMEYKKHKAMCSTRNNQHPYTEWKKEIEHFLAPFAQRDLINFERCLINKMRQCTDVVSFIPHAATVFAVLFAFVGISFSLSVTITMFMRICIAVVALMSAILLPAYISFRDHAHFCADVIEIVRGNIK